MEVEIYMSKKFGFITKNTIKKTMDKIFLAVLAEEPPVGDPPITPPVKKDPPVVNFEDLVSKARQEEKAKLYPQIEKLKLDITALTESSNAHLLTIGNRDAEIETLKAKLKLAEEGSSKSDSDAVVALKKELKEVKKTLVDVEKNAVDVEKLEADIRAEYDVKLYREQKLRESSEVIEELVTGSTKEEIDSSFEVAKTRYAGIKGSATTTNTMGKIPVINVSTTAIDAKDFKIEDLANMDVRSPEYKAMRIKLGLR